jgi:hypothetical protein
MSVATLGTARLAPLLALAALTLVPPLARADVYKCAGDSAIPVYQEMPCAQGKELRNFQIDPPLITILPAPGRAAAPSPVAPKEAPVNGAKAGKDARPGKSALAGNAAERRLIRNGMTEAEVLAKLGHPDMTTGARNSGVVRWTYMPAPGDPETITALTLTKGTVTDIERKVTRK